MKILILGSTGMLGKEVFRLLSNTGNLSIFTSARSDMKDSKNHLKIDLLESSSIDKIENICPDIVIYCVANTSIEYCEKNPDIAKRIHGDIPSKISSICKKIFYISTDSVFDGSNAPYRESDKPAPVNSYGLSKVYGEEQIRKHAKDYVIIRTNIFGIQSSRGKSLTEWAISNLQNGKSINGFHDLKFNALSVYQLAEAINFLIGCNFSGTINVAGDYSISKYEFLNYIANYIGIDESLVIKSDSRDFFNVARPKNTTLSIKNIKQLGFTNLKLKEGMEYIANKIREV